MHTKAIIWPFQLHFIPLKYKFHDHPSATAETKTNLLLRDQQIFDHMGVLWPSDLLLPQHLQEVTYVSANPEPAPVLTWTPAQVPVQPVDLHQSLQEVVCHQDALHHFPLQEVSRPKAANLHMPLQEVGRQLHPQLAVGEKEHRGPHPVVGGHHLQQPLAHQTQHGRGCSHHKLVCYLSKKNFRTVEKFVKKGNCVEQTHDSLVLHVEYGIAGKYNCHL